MPVEALSEHGKAIESYVKSLPVWTREPNSLLSLLFKNRRFKRGGASPFLVETPLDAASENPEEFRMDFNLGEDRTGLAEKAATATTKVKDVEGRRPFLQEHVPESYRFYRKKFPYKGNTKNALTVATFFLHIFLILKSWPQYHHSYLNKVIYRRGAGGSGKTTVVNF